MHVKTIYVMKIYNLKLINCNLLTLSINYYVLELLLIYFNLF